MIKILKYLLFVLILPIVSCRKDKPEETAQPKVSVGNSGGVYITDEGNFQFGNAKVSYYDIANAMVAEDLFQPANNVSLGDVCQSMYLLNGKAYIVVNNSGKVVVVNPLSFVTTTTITGFTSPRYFLPVSNNKAYVTDLYSNAITIVDLSSNSISGKISCTGWTEELTLVYGKAFVTNIRRNKVYVVNTATDVVIDSIAVSYGTSSIKQDKNGKLWVLCSGDKATNKYAGLHRINPITNQVELSLPFPNIADSPSRLSINGNLDVLYYLLSDGVHQLNITDIALNSVALIPKGTRNFYGLGVDPKDGVIYVSDAIDYVQRGVVSRYQPNGTLINSFKAGITPNNFYFN
jgi:hypothetical protein